MNLKIMDFFKLELFTSAQTLRLINLVRDTRIALCSISPQMTENVFRQSQTIQLAVAPLLHP